MQLIIFTPCNEIDAPDLIALRYQIENTERLLMDVDEQITTITNMLDTHLAPLDKKFNDYKVRLITLRQKVIHQSKRKKQKRFDHFEQNNPIPKKVDTEIEKDVKFLYQRLAQKCHSDKTTNPDLVALFSEAKECYNQGDLAGLIALTRNYTTIMSGGKPIAYDVVIPIKDAKRKELESKMVLLSAKLLQQSEHLINLKNTPELPICMLLVAGTDDRIAHKQYLACLVTQIQHLENMLIDMEYDEDI